MYVYNAFVYVHDCTHRTMKHQYKDHTSKEETLYSLR